MHCLIVSAKPSTTPALYDVTLFESKNYISLVVFENSSLELSLSSVRIQIPSKPEFLQDSFYAIQSIVNHF